MERTEEITSTAPVTASHRFAMHEWVLSFRNRHKAVLSRSRENDCIGGVGRKTLQSTMLSNKAPIYNFLLLCFTLHQTLYCKYLLTLDPKPKAY
jgi:hypothetical protein